MLGETILTSHTRYLTEKSVPNAIRRRKLFLLLPTSSCGIFIFMHRTIYLAKGKAGERNVMHSRAGSFGVAEMEKISIKFLALLGFSQEVN